MLQQMVQQLQTEVHQFATFMYVVLLVLTRTGLIAVPVVLLLGSWLQAKARSMSRNL